MIEKVLEPVSRNEIVRFQRSQWQAGTDRGWVEFRPGNFLIVEGVTAAREAFAPYLTYAIWIEAPSVEKPPQLLPQARGSSQFGGSATQRPRCSLLTFAGEKGHLSATLYRAPLAGGALSEHA